MLIDTNIIINYFKLESKCTKFIKENENLITSYIVVGEFIQGIKNKQELRYIRTLIRGIDINYGSEEISQIALELLSQHKLKNGIGLMDALIAATALELNIPLVTLNTKHFSCIKGLQLIQPQ